MIIVPNFCDKDWALMMKSIQWMKELDGRLDFHCVLAYDQSTRGDHVAAVAQAANDVFSKVEMAYYPPSPKKTWPAGPNWAWQNMARYMAALHNDSWLFLEADAIPIRKGWLHDIAAEHVRSGKPFSGHIVDGMGHLNGCAVYPKNVMEYSVNAMMTEESAWDVVLGSDLALRDGGVSAHCHPSHALFQHCWCINPADGKAWNGSGELATFKNTRDVVRLVDLTMALFHRNKDGTLIDMLRQHYAHPELAMVPQHTEQVAYVKTNPSEPDRVINPADFQGEWSAEDEEEKSPEVEAEPVVGEGGVLPAVQLVEKPATVDLHLLNPFTGQCEILIVTYGLPTKRASGQTVSDFDWLRWCLRCIRKHCAGFQGITVCFPNRDAERFVELANEHAKSKCGIPLRIQMYAEKDRRGMIQHMAMMAGADQLVPKSTTHVLHVDADVMFKEPVTPDEYFHGDKPVYVVRSWKSLSSSDGKVVSDCLQWKEPTDKQLGFESEIYGMCRHPTGMPIGFYQKYREHIESVQGKPFVAYMLEGRNEFPQNRMDWTAMGAYAYAKMKQDFAWIDISEGNHLAPRDKCKTWWSHGGITPAIQQEMEGFLKP